MSKSNAARTDGRSAADDPSFFISFEPVLTDAPACLISRSIDNDDILNVARYALRSAKNWEGRPFETSARTLEQKSIKDIATAVYWDLSSDGVLKGGMESFSKEFFEHCAVSGDFASTAIALCRSSVTGMRLYTTPNLRIIHPVEHVAVLTVAHGDRSHLPEIIAHFNELVAALTSEERSHGIPFRAVRPRRGPTHPVKNSSPEGE